MQQISIKKVADSKFSDAWTVSGHGPSSFGDPARLARLARHGPGFLLGRPGPPVPTSFRSHLFK